MGFFSWMFADTDNKKRLIIGTSAFVACPDGTFIKESYYDGYGNFNGHDIYELVVDWNKDYLSIDNFIVPQPEQYGSNEFYERAYRVYQRECEQLCDLQSGMTDFEMEQKYGQYWKREFGIAFACYDEQNTVLKYPIKICHTDQKPYEMLPASNRDPMQGCY